MRQNVKFRGKTKRKLRRSSEISRAVGNRWESPKPGAATRRELRACTPAVRRDVVEANGRGRWRQRVGGLTDSRPGWTNRWARGSYLAYSRAAGLSSCAPHDYQPGDVVIAHAREVKRGARAQHLVCADEEALARHCPGWAGRSGRPWTELEPIRQPH